MLEAVGSTIQTASLSRASVEQVSASDSYAANPERVQKAAQAPYTTLTIHMDVDIDKAVLQIRDRDTGDIVEQIPSESSLEAHRREVARQADRDVTVLSSVSSGDAGGASPFGQGQTSPDVQEEDASTARYRQQVAAFQTAARAGASNAGTLTLFA